MATVLDNWLAFVVQYQRRSFDKVTFKLATWTSTYVTFLAFYSFVIKERLKLLVSTFDATFTLRADI